MLALRNSLYLAIPTALLALCYTQKWILWPDFSLSIPFFLKIRSRIPFMQNSAENVLLFLFFLATIIFLFSCPLGKFKKYISCFLFSTLMCFYFKIYFLALCVFAFILLYSGLKVSLKKNKLGLLLITIGFVYLYYICQYQSGVSRLAFLLLAQVVFATYSIYWDIHRKVADLSIMDCWILMFTLPGGVFAIFYSYHELKKSFMNTDYSAISRSGVFLLLKGLLLAFAATVLESAFWPVISVDTYQVKTLATSIGGQSIKAWYFAMLFLVFFILEQVATLHIIQGITRILGYNVAQQSQNLILSRSTLDFWRRNSYNSRVFMMNYFFMPTFLKTKSLFLSNVSVWFMYVVITSIAAGGINSSSLYSYDNRIEIWVGQFFKFGVFFFIASYLEMKLQTLFAKNQSLRKSKIKRFLYNIILYAILIMILVIIHELRYSHLTTLNDTLNAILLLLGVS